MPSFKNYISMHPQRKGHVEETERRQPTVSQRKRLQSSGTRLTKVTSMLATSCSSDPIDKMGQCEVLWISSLSGSFWT